MKKWQFLYFPLPLFMASFLFAQTTYVWDNEMGNGLWGAGNNWTPDAPIGAPSNNDIVVFSSTSSSSQLDKSYIINKLKFEDGNNVLSLNGHQLLVTNTFSAYSNLLSSGGSYPLTINGNGGTLQVGISTAQPAKLVGIGWKKQWAGTSPFISSVILTNTTFKIYAEEAIIAENTNRWGGDYLKATLQCSTMSIFRVKHMVVGDHSGATGIITAVKNGYVEIGETNYPCRLRLGRQVFREFTTHGVIHATNWTLKAYLSDLILGSGISYNGGYGVGSLTLDADDEVQVENAYIGGYTNGCGYGYVTLADGNTLKLGTSPSKRANILAIGYHPDTGGPSCLGRLIITNGIFRAWLNEMYVGRGNYAIGNGIFRGGPTNEIIANLIVIGRGHGGGGGRGYGWLEAVSNGIIQLGTAEYPVQQMYIGWQVGDQLCTGTVNATSWKLRANIKCLDVARCIWTGTANGILNLDADDVVNVSTLRVATTTSSGPARGIITLYGGQIGISNNLIIGINGTITNHVMRYPSGIVFAGNSMTINGKYHIIFYPPRYQGIYWGLKWYGNHTNELHTLYSSGKITWDTGLLPPDEQSQVGIKYVVSDNYTFIGYRFVAKGSVFSIR